jgi:NADPH2:quinone reductase
MGSLYVTSAGLADYIRRRADLLERAGSLFDAIENEVLRIAVNRRYPLAEAAQAHRDLESRRTVGSAILLP